MSAEMDEEDPRVESPKRDVNFEINVVNIIGCPGSGKSSLIEALRQDLMSNPERNKKIGFLLEPVQEFQNLRGTGQNGLE